MKRVSSIALLGWVLLAWANPVGDYDQFLYELALRESTNTPSKVNKYNYLGLYQMGEPALIDAGYYKKNGELNNNWQGHWTGKHNIKSVQDFLNSPTTQTAAVTAYHEALWKQLQAKGLDNLIGKKVNGVVITPSGLLAGAHLIGAGGMRKCLTTGKGCADANGTKAMSYISKFAGYNVASITGGNYATGEGPGGSQPVGGGGGNGGQPVGGGGGNGGQPVGGGGPMAGYVAPDPSDAFEKSTKISMAQLKNGVLEILAVLLPLWVAWISLCQFSSWQGREVAFMDMQTTIVRALVMMSLMLVIFLV